MLDKIALSLLIVGGINWGSIGLFQFDIVGFLFGGQSGVVSRIVYVLVALASNVERIASLLLISPSSLRI